MIYNFAILYFAVDWLYCSASLQRLAQEIKLFHTNTEDNVLFQFYFTCVGRFVFQRVKNPDRTLKR